MENFDHQSILVDSRSIVQQKRDGELACYHTEGNLSDTLNLTQFIISIENDTGYLSKYI